MNQGLTEEWNKFIDELSELMDKTPGNVVRIVDCTLKEEWRREQGYDPFDGEFDRDLWKYTYEYIEEGNTHVFEEYKEYAKRCGLDAGVMKLKYPRIAAKMEL